jgi:uncharacterized protein (TIGR02118 family)
VLLRRPDPVSGSGLRLLNPRLPKFAEESHTRKGKPMFCASVTYPIDAENFDVDYFATTHAPMFARLLGDNCVRFEVHRALSPPGAPVATFVAAAYFWVTSAEGFGATLNEHGDKIYSDISNFSGTQPLRGWAEVCQDRPVSQ